MIRIVLTLLIVVSHVIAQYTQLYFFFPSQTFNVNLPITHSDIAAPSENNCNCTNGVAWLSACKASVSNNVASFQIQIEKTGGYCSALVVDGTNTNLPAAFIRNIYISPVARPTYTGKPQTITIQTQPSLSYANIASVMQGNINITSTLLPNINAALNTELNATFTNADIKQLYQSSVLFENQYFMIDLALSDSQMSYSITQPWILYNQPKITAVTPTLARKNTNVQFNVETSDFATNTGICKISTSTPAGANAVDGAIISSQLIQVVQQISYDNNTFSVSLDGNQFDSQVSGCVEGFDFPATNTITYSIPTDGINMTIPGCSVFAYNNLTFNSYDLVKQSSNWGAIKIRIKSESFSRIGSCYWNVNSSRVTGFTCSCIQLSDLGLTFPQSFGYDLQLNGVDWYSSTSFSGAPEVYYFAPTSAPTTATPTITSTPTTVAPTETPTGTFVTTTAVPTYSTEASTPTVAVTTSTVAPTSTASAVTTTYTPSPTPIVSSATKSRLQLLLMLYVLIYL